MKETKEKPTISSNIDGNIFAIVGIASRALKKAGQRENAELMQGRIMAGPGSYDEALQIVMDYVDFE